MCPGDLLQVSSPLFKIVSGEMVREMRSSSSGLQKSRAKAIEKTWAESQIVSGMSIALLNSKTLYVRSLRIKGFYKYGFSSIACKSILQGCKDFIV
jgi:hypothetical protein